MSDFVAQPDNSPWPAWLPIAAGLGAAGFGLAGKHRLANLLGIGSAGMNLYDVLTKPSVKYATAPGQQNTGYQMNSTSALPLGGGQTPGMPQASLFNLAKLFGVDG